MATIKLYGSKGQVTCIPFQINTVDDVPEAIAEEENIINSTASETEQNE